MTGGLSGGGRVIGMEEAVDKVEEMDDTMAEEGQVRDTSEAIGLGAGGRLGIGLFSKIEAAVGGEGTTGSTGGGGGELDVVIPSGVNANAEEAEDDRDVVTNPLV
jgi:hypothetical protein